jgi:hypothetical protein
MPSALRAIAVRTTDDHHAVIESWAQRWNCSLAAATLRLALERAHQLEASLPTGLDNA